jgi:mannose/fructose/N-acetylgalactosamine-specific phosphotransferase system component IID
MNMVKSKLSSTRTRASLIGLSVVGAVMAYATPALATETASETALKSITSTVNTEGSALFLVVVAGIASLFALLIAVTLGLKKIRTFIK